MKVVIDTNIFISFLIGKFPGKLMEKIKAKEIELIISDALLEELVETISRPKFSSIFTFEDIRELFFLIEERALKVHPTKRINDCRDPKDNIVLECALAGKADYIVTGDKDLLSLHPYKGVDIITLASLKSFLGRNQ